MTSFDNRLDRLKEIKLVAGGRFIASIVWFVPLLFPSPEHNSPIKVAVVGAEARTKYKVYFTALRTLESVEK